MPVALRYTCPAMPWVGDASLLPHLFTLLKQSPSHCDLVALAPIRVGREVDRKRLASASAEVIRTKLGELHRVAATARTSPSPAQPGSLVTALAEARAEEIG